jgi:cytochrome P450
MIEMFPDWGLACGSPEHHPVVMRPPPPAAYGARRAQRALGAVDGDRDGLTGESLRVKPVIAGVGRKVREEPFELGGYEIPVGIEINPSIAAIHRRRDRYDSPREFRPERFLGDESPDTYTWLPFGGGTRRCIGASFALFEMNIVVRRVIERTDLAAADRRLDKGVRRGVTFVPKRGARVVLRAAPRPVSGASGAPRSAQEAPQGA